MNTKTIHYEVDGTHYKLDLFSSESGLRVWIRQVLPSGTELIADSLDFDDLLPHVKLHIAGAIGDL